MMMERDYGENLFTDWDTSVKPPPPAYAPLDSFETWVKGRAFTKQLEEQKKSPKKPGPRFWRGPLDGLEVTEELKDRIEIPFKDRTVAIYERKEWEDGSGGTVEGYVYVGESRDRLQR